MTLGRGRGENREKRKGTERSPDRKKKQPTAISYSDAPTPTVAKGLWAQHPCGACGRGGRGFPLPGVLSFLQARLLSLAPLQGGWKGWASWKLLLPRRVLGAGSGGCGGKRDEQSLKELLGWAGGGEGRAGDLETSRTKLRLLWDGWRWRRFPFVPLLIRVSPKLYSTPKAGKRVSGESKDAGLGWETLLIKEKGGVGVCK